MRASDQLFGRWPRRVEGLRKVGTISYAAGEQLVRSQYDLLIQSQLVTKVLVIAATIAPHKRRDDVGREKALDVELKSPQKPWVYEPPITRRSSIPED